MSDSSQALVNIFEQKHPNGEHVYSDAEVRHVLPWLILSAGLNAEKLSTSALALVGDFAQKARLDLTSSAASVKSDIETYYRKNPIAPALRRACEAFLKNPQSTAVAASWAATRTNNSGGGWSKK